ncbi:MAG: hypothetical protein V5783_04605 [Pontiella sp.]
MSFDYHMYGSYIDYLSMDVYDGSSWTSNIWTKIGQQHSSSSDAWSSATVDLSAYAGGDAVIVRFRTKNKQWNSADPAIDNIRIEGAYITTPYAESFENGFGTWRQSADDDIDWTRNSGGTPTSNTGPSGASAGDWYLYMEPHDSGIQYKTASLECSFDLSGASHLTLSFDYHMYGNYIDYLAVDVSAGSSWTSNVWIRTGQQHTGSDSAWSNAVVNLSAFVGNSEVTIRFRAKQLEWHAADIAIDHIRLENYGLYEYEQWVIDTFAGAPEGTDTATAGNPDGDRFDNKLEWALVTDPMTPDTAPMVTNIDDSDFKVIYRRRDPDLTGVDVYASWASSLTSTVWKVNGDGLTEVSMGWNDDVETIEASVSLDGINKFIRIEANE